MTGTLAEAKAAMARAKSDLDMIEPLAKINAVSQRELVAAKATYESAKAKIQAELDAKIAELDLAMTSNNEMDAQLNETKNQLIILVK